jgi:hypothetical protein
MQFIRILMLAAVFATPIEAMACGGGGPPQNYEQIRYYPIVGDKTNHWPAEIRVNPGSAVSFLVPAKAKIVFGADKGGKESVIRETDRFGGWYVRNSRNMVPVWVDIEYDEKKFKWVHFRATDIGTSEVRMQVPGGWSRTVKFSSVEQTTEEWRKLNPSWTDPRLRTVKLNLDSEGEKKVSLDGYDSLEVTVAGNVADGWAASPASETGFELVSVERAKTTYISKPASKPSEQEGNAEQIPGVTSSIGKPELIKSPPQVKLYFSSTRSPKDSTMVIRQGSGSSGKTFEFKIEARPTPLC